MKRAFTIIELLTSITIVGLITLIALANFRGAERRQELRLAAETLASNLRLAQNMSLTGRQLPDGRIARGGYGIFFDLQNSYILFAEKLFSGIPPDLSTVNGRRDGAAGIDYQDVATVNLPPQINITILEGVNLSSLRYVSFAPPRPITCFATLDGLGVTTDTIGAPPQPQETIFGCAGNQPDQITIQLIKSGVSGSRKVIVDRRSGQISVE